MAVKKNEEISLLPCPFCGNDVKFCKKKEYKTELVSELWLSIKCSKCRVVLSCRESLIVTQRGIDGAYRLPKILNFLAKKWNKRVVASNNFSTH